MSKRQILLINDMVGHSKVGMGAMIPILSYMRHTTYSLPTALVSNTFNYGDYSVLDTTDYIAQTIKVWERLGFGCDAICTGWMYGEKQARMIADYCTGLQKQGATLFVDPVLGDGGKCYNGITGKNILAMKQMVSVADVTFPNYTEACLLTETAYREEGMSETEARELIDRLRNMGCRSILVTSCKIEGRHCVAGYSSDDNRYFILDYEEIPGQFHGTGDVFAAVLIGHYLNGKTLERATRNAMELVYKLIELNKELADRRQGVLIENFLHLL